MKLKISTLFHWLYATLMFLPILMFIPSCLYYGFNEHATNETTTTINYKYQSNEVNTLDDLIEGNIYYLDELVIKDYSYLNNEFNLTIYCLQCHLEFNDMSFDDFALDESYLDNYSLTPLYINIYGGNNSTTVMYINIGSAEFYVSYVSEDTSLILSDLQFTYVNVVDNSLQYLISEEQFLPQYTDYNVIESVTTNVEQTIPQQINNAWNSVWNLPVFAWTQNSFVTAPFSYITGLFGLSSDNSINYVFTYFVSISICWLVFDLIMYVPNLAHRWLDRSAIE